MTIAAPLCCSTCSGHWLCTLPVLLGRAEQGECVCRSRGTTHSTCKRGSAAAVCSARLCRLQLGSNGSRETSSIRQGMRQVSKHLIHVIARNTLAGRNASLIRLCISHWTSHAHRGKMHVGYAAVKLGPQCRMRQCNAALEHSKRFVQNTSAKDRNTP